MDLTLDHPRLEHHLLAPRAVFSETDFAKLTNFNITALDVGARGGFDVLLAPIAPLVHCVGFDPDAQEIRRLEAVSGPQGWGGIRYVPVALGEPAEGRTLYLTHSPGCCSLFEPNPAVFSRYGRDELFRVDGTAPINTLGLDAVVHTYGLQDAAYLKLDIQGAELEVLRTGDHLLDQSITAIRCEVEFQPVYRQQPLFRDLDTFLCQRGFVLAGFHQPIAWSLQPPGHPSFHAGRDCLGDLIHADTFYLRHPERYSDADEEGIRLCVRGGLIALALGRTSYAAALLNRPQVASWLADVQCIDSQQALNKARRLLRRHQRRKLILQLIRQLLRSQTS